MDQQNPVGSNNKANQGRLRLVNLNGYRFSPYWIGCYRIKENFSIQAMQDAIDLFIQEFTSELGHCHILSSLVVIDSIPITDSDEVFRMATEAEKSLFNHGIIRLIDEDDEFDIHDQTDFIPFQDVHAEIVRDISISIMSNPRIFGHVFFIFERLGLAVYPHDETGFGFIGIDENFNPEKVDVFLKHVENATFGSLLR